MNDLTELIQDRLQFPQNEKRILAEHFKIIPLYPDSKRPKYKNWTNYSGMKPAEANKHWSINESDNVGILTGKKSNVIVIDADEHNPGDKAPEALLNAFPEVRETAPHVKTGRGEHWLYEYPTGIRVDSGICKLDGQNIEILSDGRMAVAPISTTNGIVRVFDPYGQNILQQPPERLLQWILETSPPKTQGLNYSKDKIIQFKYPVKPCTQQLANYQPLNPVGQREALLFDFITMLKRDRYGMKNIDYYVRMKNNNYIEPLPNSEIMNLLRQAEARKENPYKLTCPKIESRYSWIDCTECKKRGHTVDLYRVYASNKLSREEKAIYCQRVYTKEGYGTIAKEWSKSKDQIRNIIKKVEKTTVITPKVSNHED